MRKNAQQVIFGITGRGELAVEAERLVLAGWPPSVGRDWAIVSHGLPLWLESHGHPVLHGACLAKDGQAVAILAESGQGKSTFTAALTQQGCQLLSDDVFALYFNSDETITIYPGPPHARLNPDSAAALAVPLPNQPDHDGKLKISPNAQAVSPQPLKAICLLERTQNYSGPPQAIPLKPSAALLALTQHSYLDNATYVLHPPAERLAKLAHVVEKIPVMRWVYPSGFDQLLNVSRQWADQFLGQR